MVRKTGPIRLFDRVEIRRKGQASNMGFEVTFGKLSSHSVHEGRKNESREQHVANRLDV
jgi:hypothetical protein